MKRIFLFSLAAVLLTIIPARADLIVEEHALGQKVTLDTNTGYYWYYDLSAFANKSFSEQIAEISVLGNYGNINGGWHLANYTEIRTLFEGDTYEASEIAFAFSPSEPSSLVRNGRFGIKAVFPLPPFIEGTAEVYFGSAPPPQMFDYYKRIILDPFSMDTGAYPELGAWVVTDQGIVPVPGALILATTGLLSSALGLNRLRRKH